MDVFFWGSVRGTEEKRLREDEGGEEENTDLKRHKMVASVTLLLEAERQHSTTVQYTSPPVPATSPYTDPPVLVRYTQCILSNIFDSLVKYNQGTLGSTLYVVRCKTSSKGNLYNC